MLALLQARIHTGLRQSDLHGIGCGRYLHDNLRSYPGRDVTRRFTEAIGLNRPLMWIKRYLCHLVSLMTSGCLYQSGPTGFGWGSGSRRGVPRRIAVTQVNDMGLRIQLQ